MKRYSLFYKHSLLNDELFSIHTTREEAEAQIGVIIQKKEKENEVAHKYVRGISSKYKREKFWIQEVVVIEPNETPSDLEF